MNRRDFARLAAAAAPAAMLSSTMLRAQRPTAGKVRTFEVTTAVHVLQPRGATRIWLPQPLETRAAFQKVLSASIDCPAGRTSLHETPKQGLRILAAEFPAGAAPAITTVHRVSTQSWSVPLDGVRPPGASANPASAASFLQPTRYVPTDGIVKARADEITRGCVTDLEKAHAVYTWIVDNTYRKAAVQGCGRGDIRPMLETGDLGGKCADLNGLFAGLMRASGVPARDVYGLRAGPTELECHSLGTSSPNVAKAQHCRAEVFLAGYGWVPMDPADVRKVMLEEKPGNLTLTDPLVAGAEQRLFGSWEMNWIAYNYAQDVTLPGSAGPPIPFLMYPQAETADGRLDSLDAAAFHYEITSREITA